MEPVRFRAGGMERVAGVIPSTKVAFPRKDDQITARDVIIRALYAASSAPVDLPTQDHADLLTEIVAEG